MHHSNAWFMLRYAEKLGWPSNVNCGDGITVPGGTKAAWTAWTDVTPDGVLHTVRTVLFDICSEVNDGHDVSNPATWATVSARRKVEEAEKDRLWLADVTDGVAKKRQKLLNDLSDLRWPRIHVKTSWGRGGKWIKGEGEWQQAIADAHGDPGCRLHCGDTSDGLHRFIEAVEAYQRSPRIRQAANRTSKLEPVSSDEQATLNI